MEPVITFWAVVITAYAVYAVISGLVRDYLAYRRRKKKHGKR